jgi:hypothetical protein
MLQQILIRTPFYVWVILAGLLYRGYIASTDREVTFWKLFIIPAIMPLLTLPDLALKFGAGAQTFAIWGAAAGAATLLTWQFSSARVTPAQRAGNVLVRGSWMPLAAMMAVFFSKYALNIVLAISPQARHETLFATLFCALFGIFNGIFFGSMAKDATAYTQARSPRKAIASIS